MSDALSAASIWQLLVGPKGARAIFALWDGGLTSTRAGRLDNLPNISRGPVALQKYLGKPADAAGMTTTVFAALKQIDTDVLGLAAYLSSTDPIT